jgi:TRAP-type C4-dicarboxylate transport system permease small subunit
MAPAWGTSVKRPLLGEGDMGTMEKIASILERINLVMGIISGIAIVSMTFVICFEMIARRIFGHPTMWSQDASQYLFLLVCFFAFTFTMQQDGHITFSLLLDRVKKHGIASKLFVAVSGVFGAMFCGLLIFVSAKFTIIAARFGWLSQGQTPIPSFYLFGIMCLGSILFLGTFIMKAILILFDSGKH